MKLFIALAMSVLVAGVAEAREKSTKTIPVIVWDGAKQVWYDAGDVPKNIGEFAKENDCYHGGKNSRCIYQLPLRGIGEPVVIGLGKISGDIVLVATDVPTRMLDFMAVSFEQCAANPRDNVEKSVCQGFAWAFNKAGDLTYFVGHYTADSINMTARTGAYSLEMTSSAIDNLSKGKLGSAAGDIAGATLGAGGCLVMSVFKAGLELALNGRPNGINCDVELRNSQVSSQPRVKVDRRDD